MRRGELLERLAEERANLLWAIEGLEEEEMTLPGVEGEWSVKDLLGHIAAWEREARLVAQKIAEEDAPCFDYQIDPRDEWREWNAREVEKRRGLPLSDILEELTAEHEKFKEMVEGLGEEQLSRKAISPWGWETTVEEQIRVQYQHEWGHARSILEWRKRKG